MWLFVKLKLLRKKKLTINSEATAVVTNCRCDVVIVARGVVGRGGGDEGW